MPAKNLFGFKKGLLEFIHCLFIIYPENPYFVPIKNELESRNRIWFIYIKVQFDICKTRNFFNFYEKW